MDMIEYSRGYIDALNVLKRKIDELVVAHEYALDAMLDAQSQQKEKNMGDSTNETL